MKCPHCTINFHEDWAGGDLYRRNQTLYDATLSGMWEYKSTTCPECSGVTIMLRVNKTSLTNESEWRLVHPIGANRGPVAAEVPPAIASDYIEACNVLPISPKASAALSRRCLQNILHNAGYTDRDLAREIQALLDESDSKKAVPAKLRQTIDSIRALGNFSAHPIDDKTSLQIIDVEPYEAEWCLDVIEEMFQHFYVGPAQALARKAAIDAKLVAAGKQPTKG